MPLSTFLNGGTAVQLRGLAWLALSDSGHVGAGTVTSDAGGGGVTSWGYGAAVPCRVDPVAGFGTRSGVVAGRIEERSTHVITTPVSVTMTTANRFLIDGRGTFEVVAAHRQTAPEIRYFEVVAIS